MKIYDCITFFQSNLLFELRFHTLKNIVDHFVICEATKTHMGKPKKILFNLFNATNETSASNNGVDHIYNQHHTLCMCNMYN